MYSAKHSQQSKNIVQDLLFVFVLSFDSVQFRDV